MAFGTVQPAHEPFRQWVASSPAVRDHLQWLSSQLDLPAPVPVVFMSCGVVNAFYRPDRREIQICFEWIIDRRDHVETRTPGAEKVTDAVARSLAHVINHEVGHALIHQLQLPVLGREEDAADGFSAFLLLARGEPLDAYSALQGALANQTGFFVPEDQADVHSLGQQRFFNLLCWLYGSDPGRFVGFAAQGGLPEGRRRSCPMEWNQLTQSWPTVLGPHLKPKPAVVAAGPQRLTIASAQRVALPAGATWTTRFQLPSGPCQVHLAVTGVEGGQLDLVTMVLDDYNYLTWESKRTGVYWEPAFRSGRERRVVADIPLKGPGRFALVVSNDFSLLTAKVAEVTGSATCQ